MSSEGLEDEWAAEEPFPFLNVISRCAYKITFKFNYLLVLAIGILVQKAKILDVVPGKVLTLFIRVSEVVLGIKKRENDCNTGGANNVSPRVGEALDSLKMDVSNTEDRNFSTYLLIDRGGCRYLINFVVGRVPDCLHYLYCPLGRHIPRVHRLTNKAHICRNEDLAEPSRINPIRELFASFLGYHFSGFLLDYKVLYW
jgi:hypothetical protein